MASSVSDISARIVELREQHNVALSQRAAAQAAVDFAKEQRESINQKLKDLGVDPADAENALELAEKELDALVTELSQRLSAAITQYNEVVALSKTASGGTK